MSFSFQIQRINDSFVRIASWYKEFMHRTEQSFRLLHRRIAALEERQALRGPTDEQVERVLRKILAERFADVESQRLESPESMKDHPYFVQRPNEDLSVPQPVQIDVASLHVDPDAVPSEKYTQDFEMLESKLDSFPAVDLNSPPPEDIDVKHPSMRFKQSSQPQVKRDRTGWS